MVAMIDLYNSIRKCTEGSLSGQIFDPEKDPSDPKSLVFAVRALRDSIDAPPENLLPLLPVCDGSFACVVCDRDILDKSIDQSTLSEVVRWHLGLIEPEKQGELLDTDPLEYLNSLSEEMSRRSGERLAIEGTATKYYENYVVKAHRPRADELRPVQLACQNVIIGLASLRHDPIFDGLRVEAYTTCEVAHLATGEADRAMAALVLCDAFQCGGTMEIRFGRQGRAEAPIPPSLRRYARVHGLELGNKEKSSISPSEARALFTTVTPMSDELRLRAFEAFDAGQVTPERLCYSLMAGIWTDIELAFLLGTTARASNILEGGSDPGDRISRSSEAESCRAAAMIAMFHKRLENASSPQGASDSVEVDEDNRIETAWTVQSDLSAVAFGAVGGQHLPWTTKGSRALLPDDCDAIIAIPRAKPFLLDTSLLSKIQGEQPKAAVRLLVPADADMTAFGGVPYLRCPLTADLLDQEVRKKLDKLRIARR